MGRRPCCDKVGLKKGPWTPDEDNKLINFLLTNGQCCWRDVPKLAGLLRCGKSCRLRWANYLRPDLKRGLLSESEEKMVIDLHSQIGNRWSKIAAHLPGRTDNEIKNHWNTHIKKKLRKMGIDPLTHKPLPPNDHHDQQMVLVQEHEAEGEKNPTESSDEFLRRSPGFCTDEVPMIEPHEIMVPSSSCSNPSSSSSCSSASPCSVGAEDELLLPCMEWPESMYLVGLDEIMGWEVDDPFNHYQGAAFDQEAWKLDNL